MPANDASSEPIAAGGAATLVAGLIRTYQLAFSWMFAGACRFTPTCSEYAREAVVRHGAARGGWLALRRLLRCRPWGGTGFDSVPEVGERVQAARRL